jgi:uncharacterized membrane protein
MNKEAWIGYSDPAVTTTSETTVQDVRREVPAVRAQRLLALDQMRGIVMLLMTIDHASDMLNSGRFVTDASWLWKPGSAIPLAQFLLRWVTHLCAPTFVFLAGVGIALSTQKRRARGESEAALSRSLAGRGLFIALLDPLWMSPVMMEGSGLLLQVLFAIGVSMMLLALLRHIPAPWLLAASIVFCVTSEWCVNALRALDQSEWSAMILTAGMFPLDLGPLQSFVIGYPILPWLAIMLLGYGCASWLSRDDRDGAVGRGLLFAGLALLALFAVVRALNGYGNMGLLRDNGDIAHWLHVSKYPPSLSYVTLELGCMALILSLLYGMDRRYQRHGGALPGPLRALTTLGQAALFFYVLHLHLMAALTFALGLHHKGGILASLLGAALCVLILAVPVGRYQRYKRAHPNGWARFL